MRTVQLPKLKTGREFEEGVAALLQLGGYHTEREVIYRDIEEVLELDIVLTSYEAETPELRIVEVKSGNWGFPDLFKVYGWMKYLGIPKGIFIVRRERENLEFIRNTAEQINIDLVVIPDLSNVEQALATVLSGIADKHIDKDAVSQWRFSYWVERCLLNRLVDQRKRNPSMRCFNTLCKYNHQINGGIFFTENIVDKIAKLYDTFMEFPHVTAKTGHELVGNNFNQENSELPKNLYKDTFVRCQYTDLHVSMFIEHRARLAILKSAVDYLMYKRAGVASKTESVRRDILGIEFDLLNNLPASFRQGMSDISKHKFLHRYPIFWQWFTWFFGGFILKDYEEQEYRKFAEKTGIPIEEIQNAFYAYEILFPMDGGWFFELPDSRARVLKMFPVPFMGIGANYRRWSYRTNNQANIDDLKVTGKWTISNLDKWTNLAVEVLTYQP